MWHESRARDPMLPLGLFARRNFAVGNVETLAVYAGLAVLFFLLTLFLQQVAGYTPLQAGLATLPVTLVMLVLSRRFGALAGRLGAAPVHGRRPRARRPRAACAAARLAPRRTTSRTCCPRCCSSPLGLSLTVAPLTAAVLACVEERQAGIASGVNNAVARVAGLLGIAALGAVVAVHFATALDAQLAGAHLSPAASAAVSEAKRTALGRAPVAGLPPVQAATIVRATNAASLAAFHVGVAIAGALVVLGGLIGGAGIQNPEGFGADGVLAGSDDHRRREQHAVQEAAG